MKGWIAALCAFVLLGFGALVLFREALDVVAIGADSAFNAVLRALPATETGEGFSVESPDGAVRMGWSRSERSELFVSLDARPFLNAGLSADQSPYPIKDGRMIISFGLPASLNVPETLMRDIARQHRERIGFHTAHGRYGLSLGGGALEWAPDLAQSEKDIVFTLYSQPLAAAGVDVENVQGWTHTTTPAMENGKTVEVFALVKAFDLP